jgi:hypothetical protein
MPEEKMPTKTPLHHTPKKRPPARRRHRAVAQAIGADAKAVPFKVTAFAAAVFERPAISDASEEEPVFDKSKAQRVVKTKKNSVA